MNISPDFIQQAIEWLLSRSWVDYAEIYFVVMSIIGQHYIAERRRAGFYFWLAGNVVAVVVWATLARYPSAILYLYFTYKCITGSLTWRRLEQQQQVLPASAAASRA